MQISKQLDKCVILYCDLLAWRRSIKSRDCLTISRRSHELVEHSSHLIRRRHILYEVVWNCLFDTRVCVVFFFVVVKEKAFDDRFEIGFAKVCSKQNAMRVSDVSQSGRWMWWWLRSNSSSSKRWWRRSSSSRRSRIWHKFQDQIGFEWNSEFENRWAIDLCWLEFELFTPRDMLHKIVLFFSFFLFLTARCCCC